MLGSHIVLQCNVEWKKLYIVLRRRGQNLENLEKVREKQVFEFLISLTERNYKWILHFANANAIADGNLTAFPQHSSRRAKIKMTEFLPLQSTHAHSTVEYAQTRLLA